MNQIYIPQGYRPALDAYDTQRAIAYIKETFQEEFSKALNLKRVSAPLFVTENSGLNDNLNGYERPVAFDVPAVGIDAQVVHSLAKWKRLALKRYNFTVGNGLYTDMNAIRRDEITDNLHSVYVDQWDWEKVLTRQQRNYDTLMDAAMRIHAAVLEAETVLHSRYPVLAPRLPATLAFISSQELCDMYPELTPEQREAAFVKEHRAAFVSQIGWPLSDGKRHGDRAPDYDDWSLNGDLIYYHPELDCALEVSSMGIRVDAPAMFAQLSAAGAMDRLNLPFHQQVMRDQLPLTMGGGIGQSRLCMLLLRKAHIGEVQCSTWPDGVVDSFAAKGVPLL